MGIHVDQMLLQYGLAEQRQSEAARSKTQAWVSNGTSTGYQDGRHETDETHRFPLS